jgi:uncharacterized protein (TIGR00255 family)
MLKSMTAYGRASKTTKIGNFSVEIQSVNRKHLEIHTNLPKELQRFDHEIRKLIGKSATRGQITFRLNARFEEVSPTTVAPNLPLVKQIKIAADKIAKELGVDASAVILELLGQQTDVLINSDELVEEQLYWSTILEVTNEALMKFTEMRQKEGEALQKDIVNYFKRLRQHINQIAAFAPMATNKFFQKLKERIEEVVPGAIENEERLLRELCVYAERVDNMEEITRFNSHLDQCEHLLNSEVTHAGKTLEFLLQELGRETNTIGSKSSELEVSRLIVEMKGDLERIREQIQNVE